VGTLIKPEQKLLLVCPENREQECVIRLARVGYENVLGYLAGGIKAWIKAGKPTQKTPSIQADELPSLLYDPNTIILDVRKPLEALSGHLPNAININLQQLEEHLNQLDPNNRYLVHCAGGYRSTIACSILERNHFSNFINVKGGFKAIKQVPNIPIVTGQEQLTIATA
jgi:rhodanese-related sulfurtransferase